ncbi:protein AMN1 homolog [Branchiostoma floridae x Branchiostoma japonicum]
MAAHVNNHSSVASLLSWSLRSLVANFSCHANHVHTLPPNIKDKLVHLMSKRGVIRDDNIGKVVHQKMRELDLSESEVSDLSLEQLSVCRNLRKIDLNAVKGNTTTVTTAGILSLVRSCHLLQVVHLRRCIEVTDDAIVALSENCRQLMCLNIGGCAKITDRSLDALGQNSRMLRSINFGHTKVTDDGVISLATGKCRQCLTEVHMDGCQLLTDDAVEVIMESCPRISILIFHSCPKITDRSRVALEELSGPNSKMKQVTWTIY